MADQDYGWEIVPSYTELLVCLYEFSSTLTKELLETKSSLQSVKEIRNYFNFSFNDVLLIAFIGLTLTIIRYVLTEKCFKPLAYRYNLTPSRRKKFAQSLWYITQFSFTTSFSLYVVMFSGRYRFFQRPSTVWTGWSLNEPVPQDIYWLLMTQMGLVISALYAVAFLDLERKDTAVYAAHHIIVLVLVSGSYSLRMHKIGSLILAIHDVTEVPLESAKLSATLREQGGKRVRMCDILCKVLFAGFVLLWSLCRLYYFPLKGIYTAMHLPAQARFLLPAFLIIFLWLLQVLHICWTLSIIRVIISAAMGKEKQLEDVRDSEDDVTKQVPERLVRRKKSSGDVPDIRPPASDEKDHEIKLRGKQRTHH